MTQTRLEHDSLGSREVPAEAYYGIHTLRAAETFHLLGRGVHPELLRALLEVKKACAVTNLHTGYLAPRVGEAIVRACDLLLEGAHRDQFLTDALQGGAGTSLNMNANEVIASVACELLGGSRGQHELVHPLDHVNLSQSTNDVVPTAVRLAGIRLLRRAAAAVAELQAALQERERALAGVLKVGRTELQDALPITLGQELAAWAQAVQRDWWRLSRAEERLRQVNLGGTAIGTGLNADPRYLHRVVEVLREQTGVGLARAENLVDATQNCDVFVEVSGLLKAAAATLAKIAADLRLLSSGPRAGLGEVRLPELQAGSSIMPGKVNPVVPEAVTQAAFQIIANDAAVTLAAASGQLELNAFLPLLADRLLESLQLVAGAAELLARRCIAGLTADEERCAELLERSLVPVTALSPYLGYEAAAALARDALASGRTIGELARERRVLPEEQLARVLAPEELTRPGVAGLGPRR